MDAQIANLLVNREFSGRFKTRGILGIGGNGAVYELTPSSNSNAYENYVIKLVLRDVADRSARSQRREIVQWLFLDHPHILKCVEVGSDVIGSLNILYLILERADSSLADRLKLNTLTIQETLDLYRSIASALRTLHSLGLVHRDIKPHNILRVLDCWKLSDFGLIRDVGDLSRKYTKGFQGTLMYAAPEVLRTTPRISRKSDVYSAALVLFESYYRVRYSPSEDDSRLEQDLLSADPDVRLLASVLTKCLRPMPGSRPTSEELCSLLGVPAEQSFSDGLPTSFSIGTGGLATKSGSGGSVYNSSSITIEEVFEAGRAWSSLALTNRLGSGLEENDVRFQPEQVRMQETVKVFHVSLFGNLSDISEMSEGFEAKIKMELLSRNEGRRLVAWFDLGAIAPAILAFVLAKEVKVVQQLSKQARSAIVAAELSSAGVVEAMRLLSLVSQLAELQDAKMATEQLGESYRGLVDLLLREAKLASGDLGATGVDQLGFGR